MVTVSTGLGIDRKIDGRLYIRCGPGITCNTDNDLTVRYGSGLDVLDGKLVLHEDIYYRLDSAEGGIGKCINAITNLHTAVGGKQNTLTIATGLEWGKTDMIQVKMNAPLNYDNCGRLKLDYDSTLTVSNNKLGVYTYGIINNEGGLTIKNNGLAVDVGSGLMIDSCQVVVNYGTGMSESNNKIYVDTEKIAGVGIDLDSDYKKLTIGTKAAQELAGKGLVAEGPKIKVKYGSGLTTNSCEKLIVDAANLTVGNADKLGGKELGYKNGKVPLYVPFPNYISIISMGYLRSDYESVGYPIEDYLKAICKWAIATYPNIGDTLMGTASPVDDGFLILSMYSAAGYDATSLLPRYCTGWYMSLGGASYRFGTYNYVWSIHETASLDSVVVHAGEGLASGSHNGQLKIPRLTASVANGAVDGVKNNNQRVLNLSCGAIQIKLSTGLAIDDSGYLYVQDKYVTK
jgi:hypothetical protein